MALSHASIVKLCCMPLAVQSFLFVRILSDVKYVRSKPWSHFLRTGLLLLLRSALLTYRGAIPHHTTPTEMRLTVLYECYPSHFLILSKFVKMNFFVKNKKLDELKKVSLGVSLVW